MWLAQTSIDPNPWAQLGISSVVSALLFAGLLAIWRAYVRKSNEKDAQQDKHVAEIRELLQAQLTRERELSNQMAPMLSQSLDTLKIVPELFARMRSAIEDLERRLH